MQFGCMNVLGYSEEVLLLFTYLSCKSSLLSILESFFSLTFVYMVRTSSLLCYFKDLVHNIWFHRI
jgi:hypothetical protein